VSPFLLLVLAGFLARFGYQMARSPVLPRFAQDLGAAPALLGLIVAASTVTGVVIKLPAGALSDLLGRKRMMLLGCCFFAGPPLLYPFVHSPGALLGVRFLHGFATAIFSPVASAYVADLTRRERGEKLGWFAAANDLGATAGPLLGGLLLFYTAGYTATYLAVSVFGILPLLAMLRMPDANQPAAHAATLGKRSRQFWTGIAEVLSNRPVLVASTMEAAMYVGYGAFLGFFPPYGKRMGLNDGQIALVMGAQLTAAMVAKPFSGRLSDRLGRKPLIVAGLFMCAATLPGVPILTSLWALAFISCLFGLGVAIVTPSTTALVADLVKAGRMGSAMGVFGTIWDCGEAGGPILAGLLISALSYRAAFALIAAFMAAVACLFMVMVSDASVPVAAKGGELRSRH
jgi:DHA1 family multidrug resistance protein-like MFS transporter